ncbi:hypothetical protein OG785_10040 [Streptomyces sp. NBC_00006]|uniref:hypothetical protein n=1 Tax=Streptomyces sp. NBC_00006 TaxID=2975619 RepID=UPI002256D6B5|nr:hypothetical protein [Streptomyces sp. NBC_00006]MCX5530898.1 hypothetical protein [Streptomyces sp. NBC_00006]
MSTPHGHGPAPTATVIRTGQRNATKALPLGIVLTAVGLLVLFGGVAITVGLGEDDPSPKGVVGIVMGLLILFVSVTSLISAWVSRRSTVGIDQTGLWVSDGKVLGVVPWNSLAGVGLHWSKLGRTKVYSIELCPSGPIDRDDPVLWPLVRDEAPLHPDLPRLRYRLPVPPGSRDAVVAAIQSYVPQLWLGEAERESGHMGRPDRKGHRERTTRLRGQAR